MADYLQPGGARIKFTKEERQNFLFKVTKLNKDVIAACIMDCIHFPSDNKKTMVFIYLHSRNRKHLFVSKLYLI